MAALRELQGRFYDAIVEGAAKEAASLPDFVEPPAVAQRRLAAYRRSIFGNLVSALLATYPVVAKIVGLPFFREMARRYVNAHPSASGDLNEYGERFAEFIAGYEPAAELPYLPDVARLEWLVQSVLYAADAPAPDLSVLADVPQSRWGELRFTLNPATARIDSRWPLDAIWRVNQDGYDGDMTVDFSQSSRLLVLRREGRVFVESLADGEAAFWNALAAGTHLAGASDAAAAVDAAFDLTATLSRLARDSLLLSAHLARRAHAITE